ncbi:unnamed protein product, partial [Effrenium voratum]
MAGCADLENPPEPERTPEDADELWLNAEAALQEQRSKKVQNPWRNYTGARGPSGPRATRGERSPRDGLTRATRTTRTTQTTQTAQAAQATQASLTVSTEEVSESEDLWQQAEQEIQRRREACKSRRGLRIYDISGRGKGRGKGKGKDRQSEWSVPISYPSSAQSSWRGTLVPAEGGKSSWKVLLSKRQMDDSALMHWCGWARPRLQQPHMHLTILDLSFNKITAYGLNAVLKIMREAEVPVEGMSLHHNCLGDEAADTLAQYLLHAPYTLWELQLSHNNIGNLGARALLEAAVKAVQSPQELQQGRAGPRYPCERDGKKVPLWLRLGCNALRGSQNLQRTELELFPARRSLCPVADPWGNFGAESAAAQLFCEALAGFGCDHSRCSQLYPEQPGLPAGPPVHLVLDTPATSQWRLQHSLRGLRRDLRQFPKGNSDPDHVEPAPDFVDLLDVEPIFQDFESRAPGELELDVFCSDSAGTGTPEKLARGRARILRDVELPGGLGPQVTLHAGDEVQVLYEGSDDLGDGGYLFASFLDREGNKLKR